MTEKLAQGFLAIFLALAVATCAAIYADKSDRLVDQYEQQQYKQQRGRP